MNKENIELSLVKSQEKAKQPIQIITPEDEVNPSLAASWMIELLEKMYTKHAISNNKEKLIDDISSGIVIPWFAINDTSVVATSSLINTGDAWELGRAASIDRGNGIGKTLMLKAVIHHLDNHSEPLVAEVRIANEFKGIPSSIATQQICFDTISLFPHAVLPLFAHGDPLRNEPFALSSDKVLSKKPIPIVINQILSGRSSKGILPRVRIDQKEPFGLIVLDEEGKRFSSIQTEISNIPGCTLIPVEATDNNLPLIGTLLNHQDFVACGLDRKTGQNNKPIILFATINTNFWKNEFDRSLAPLKLQNNLPDDVQKGIIEVSKKFENIFNRKKSERRAKTLTNLD